MKFKIILLYSELEQKEKRKRKVKLQSTMTQDDQLESLNDMF